MKIKFSTLSEPEQATAFAALDNDALSASLAEAKTEGTALFALTEPTIAQVEEAEVVLASMRVIETEQTRRATAAREAGERFAAAKAQFSDDSSDMTDEEKKAKKDEMPFSAGGDDDEVEGDDAETDEETDEVETDESGEAEGEADGEAVVTAAAVDHTRNQKVTAASKVGRKTARPAKAAAKSVVITASADVPGFGTGSQLSGMADVAKAMQARVKNMPAFNKRSAERAASESKGQPVLSKFGVASFGLDFTGPGAALTASSGASAEYEAVGDAVKAHVQRVTASLGLNGETAATMSAAMAWCAPSEVVYNWIADYVVDGLYTMPEIPAPRGGLMMTEGPQLAQTTYGTNAAVDGFGFGGTEAEMEAGYVKTCETIECPEFFDHRLDFDGYCWKIPILTEKAFPELVADAMRLSDVLYAHKMNRRYIRDVIALSEQVDATNALGGLQLDTLEALVQVARKERRWWNIGENAVLEVKLPQVARDMFKFDMARRSGLALNDVATDQKIAAHFANHRLAVEYLSDFDQSIGTDFGQVNVTAEWPDVIRAIIYPAGTFVRAAEDVINLSAIYDAASLSQNEYTGVFFEQGVKVIKRGYRSHVVTIPVCVAGRTGANDLTCTGFDVPADGSSF